MLALVYTHFIYLASVDSLHLLSINHIDVDTSSDYDLKASNYINLTFWYCRLHILSIIQILSNLTCHQIIKDNED